MTRFRFAFTSWLLAGVVAFAGCGGGDDDNTADDGKSNDDNAAGDDGAGGDDGKGGGGGDVPETADAAVQAVFEGLKSDDPRVVWEFLPPSYREDINGLVHEFAGKMDAELWDRSFGSLKKVMNILKTKKKFILENPALQGGDDAPLPLPPGTADDLAKNWDGIVGLLETIVSSEISDLDKLKKADVGDFVGKTGGSLMKQIGVLSKVAPDDPFNNEFKAKISAATVKIVSSERDSATISIETPDEPSKEVKFVRVEGHWIPKEMADEWEDSISEARAGLAALDPAVMEGQKKMVLGVLDMVDATLGKLEGAKTADEFNLAITEGMTPIFGMLMGGGEGGPTFPDPAEVADDAVMIVVVNKLDEDAEDDLVTKLVKKADDPDLGVVDFVGSGKGLKIEVSEVKDVAAFAKKIDFARVLAVDVKGRTITIDSSQPAAKSKGVKNESADDAKPKAKDDGEKKTEKKAA
jgi:hypothetical protein